MLYFRHNKFSFLFLSAGTLTGWSSDLPAQEDTFSYCYLHNEDEPGCDGLGELYVLVNLLCSE